MLRLQVTALSLASYRGLKDTTVEEYFLHFWLQCASNCLNIGFLRGDFSCLWFSYQDPIKTRTNKISFQYTFDSRPRRFDVENTWIPTAIMGHGGILASSSHTWSEATALLCRSTLMLESCHCCSRCTRPCAWNHFPPRTLLFPHLYLHLVNQYGDRGIFCFLSGFVD